MTHEEWESLCDGCGSCCEINDCGAGVACPALDVNTRRCTVYEKRTTTQRCVNVTPKNIKWLHQQKVLPDSCAYVRRARGLGPEPVVKPLIPFNVAHPKIGHAYNAKRERYFEQLRRE